MKNDRLSCTPQPRRSVPPSAPRRYRLSFRLSRHIRASILIQAIILRQRVHARRFDNGRAPPPIRPESLALVWHPHRRKLLLLVTIRLSIAAIPTDAGPPRPSHPQPAKSCNSRNAASSSRSLGATFFIAFCCASPPTRLTLIPTSIAGRTPARNSSRCR